MNSSKMNRPVHVIMTDVIADLFSMDSECKLSWRVTLSERILVPLMNRFDTILKFLQTLKMMPNKKNIPE